jgi:hypothetical protein
VDYVIIVIPAGLAVIVAVVFALLKRPAKVLEHRRQRMLELAGELGLRYYGTMDALALSLLPSSSLFEKDVPRSVDNLIAENRNPPRALLFDYGQADAPAQAADLRNEYEEQMLYLVAMVRLPDTARAVSARLHRKDWFGGPVNVKGLYALQFEGDRAFGESFLIAGEPRDAISRMLVKPVRQAIMSWSSRGPQPVVELMPEWVMAYVESEAGDRQAAQKATALLSYASGVVKALGEAG